MASMVSGFSAREVPFYGLPGSSVISEAPSVEDALMQAGLNWEVGLEPVYQTLRDGSVKIVTDKFLTVREDTQDVLGIVGKQYAPFQNIDAFEFADALLGYGVQFDAAGAWDHNRKVFLTAKLPEGITIEGDESGGAIDLYLLFRTTHDGSGAVSGMITPVRLACTNMLNLAAQKMVSKWTARHTRTVAERCSEAARTLGIVDAYKSAFQETADQLLSIEIGLNEMTNFVRELIPTKEDSEKDSRTQTGILQTWRNSPTVDRRTGWGALNAVGEYLEWERGGRGTVETRFESNIDGQIATIRNSAAQLLVRR